MIWLLTYEPDPNRPRMVNEKPPTKPETLKWVTGNGWEPAAIKADFERRFSGIRVVSLEPVEVAA